jgi:DNA-binding MarR family transcriptional regulator
MRQHDVASSADKTQNGLIAHLTLKGQTGVKSENIKIIMDRAQKALRFQRKQGDLLTAQALQILLNVAIQPGITMQELQKPTGLNISSVSRNLTALGKYHRLGKLGLDFAECVQDPNERRRMIAFLTPKGREFLQDYLSILTGETVYLESPTAKDYLSKAYTQNLR